MRLKLAFGLAPALLMIGTGAIAAPPAWKVSEVSGDVRLSEAGRTRAATKGALLGSSATITTAPGARAVIVRGGEFVVISPGTRLRVPEASSPNGVMQIIQDWGSALFRIEKKSTPHFGVQTPYLAAVVKGTTFTVTVGPQDAKVKVTEGAVQVSTLDGGASDLVRPGSLAMVGKSDLYRLTVQGDGAKELRSNAAPAAGAVTVKAAPTEVSAAKGDNRSARAESIRIARAIGEKPTSLAKLTGGLVDGSSAAEHAQGAFNENSRNARGPKEGKDKPADADKPAKDEKPAKEDKPAKDDEPAKEEKPAKDDKPEKDDEKPAKEDASGKDEKAGEGDANGGKSDESDKGGADKGAADKDKNSDEDGSDLSKDDGKSDQGRDEKGDDRDDDADDGDKEDKGDKGDKAGEDAGDKGDTDDTGGDDDGDGGDDGERD